MSRYIDADKIPDEILCDFCNMGCYEFKCAEYKSVKRRLQDIPTADVVEVVRCKDCKHLMAEKSNGNPYGTLEHFHVRWCTHHGWRTDDWWCADGERCAE